MDQILQKKYVRGIFFIHGSTVFVIHSCVLRPAHAQGRLRHFFCSRIFLLHSLKHFFQTVMINHSKLLTLILSAALLFVGASCKKDPPIVPPLPPVVDTTSQNFTMTTWEYGDGFASAFANDVWIFDEKNIWVVGLFPPTSSIAGEYNIMRWNGSNWVPAGLHFNSSGVESICALDSSTIFFAAGFPIKYKSGTYTEYIMADLKFSNGQQVDKIWASSESNVWGVGANGCIVHYDGVTWKKIEYDNQYNFLAITGSKESGIAYATGRTRNWNTVIVRLQYDSAKTIFQGGDLYHPQSIEFFSMSNENEILISGAVIRKFTLSSLRMDTLYTPSLYMSAMGYVAQNDIYYFGEYHGVSEVLHYNGQRFSEIPLSIQGVFLIYGASGTKSIMACCGDLNDKAFIVLLRRKSQ
jgi:hypothetical protein